MSNTYKKKEEEKLSLWANNMNKCENKVWDIFWGNLISLKHVQNNKSFLENICKIVGNDNFIFLNEELAWF